jgi:hypothetical protein
MLEKGYKCYTGKVLSDNEIALYTRYCKRVEELELTCKTGTLAQLELEHAKNQRHKMFIMLAELK